MWWGSLLSWALTSSGLFSSQTILSYVGRSLFPPTIGGSLSSLYNESEKIIMSMILKTGFEWYYKRKEDSQWKYPSVNDISNERLIIVMILGTLALLLHSTSQTELDSYLEYLKMKHKMKPT